MYLRGCERSVAKDNEGVKFGKMALCRLMNFDDIVEEGFRDLDNPNVVDSEEEQLDEDGIYVNR